MFLTPVTIGPRHPSDAWSMPRTALYRRRTTSSQAACDRSGRDAPCVNAGMGVWSPLTNWPPKESSPGTRTDPIRHPVPFS